MRAGYIAKRLYDEGMTDHDLDMYEMASYEVAAIEFGARLMSKLGGEAYTSLIKERVEAYRESDKPDSKLTNLILNGKQLIAIKKIFKTTIPGERLMILRMIQLEARLKEIDLFIPDQESAKQYKAEAFLFWVRRQ